MVVHSFHVEWGRGSVPGVEVVGRTYCERTRSEDHVAKLDQMRLAGDGHSSAEVDRMGSAEADQIETDRMMDDRNREKAAGAKRKRGKRLMAVGSQSRLDSDRDCCHVGTDGLGTNSGSADPGGLVLVVERHSGIDHGHAVDMVRRHDRGDSRSNKAAGPKRRETGARYCHGDMAGLAVGHKDRSVVALAGSLALPSR